MRCQWTRRRRRRRCCCRDHHEEVLLRQLLRPVPRVLDPTRHYRGKYEISFAGEEIRRDLHGALLRLEHSNEYHGAVGHSCLPTVQSAAAW